MKTVKQYQSRTVFYPLALALLIFLLNSCAKEDNISPVLPGFWSTSWEDETSEFEIDNLTVEEYIRFGELDHSVGFGEFIQYMKGEIEYSDFIDEAKIPYECAITGRWQVRDGDEINLAYNMPDLEVAVGNFKLDGGLYDGSDVMDDLFSGDFGEMIFKAAMESSRQKQAAKKISKEVTEKVTSFFHDYFKTMNDDKEALTNVEINGNTMTCKVNDGFFNRKATYKRDGAVVGGDNSGSGNSSKKSSATSRRSSRATYDTNLIDIVYSASAVEKGYPSLNLFHIGNNYESMLRSNSDEMTKTLTGVGMIGDDNCSVKCWLTGNGELHGRYHNENGTNLDLNGYIKPNGSLYIQLGHASEKSEWHLSPVKTDTEGTFRYEGTWGRKDKPSHIVFQET